MTKGKQQFEAWMKVQNSELHMTSVRLPIPLIDAIDKWRGQWKGKQRPTRSDAIRYVLEQQFLTGGKND